MRKNLEQFSYFILGFLILIAFYYISLGIIKLLNIPLPPAILALILFVISLIKGVIKEKWIKLTCEFLINNMAMFLVPLFCGLIAYKALLIKNWFAIFIVIFLTTTLVIVFVGLFVEWGIKFLRLNRIKKLKGSAK